MQINPSPFYVLQIGTDTFSSLRRVRSCKDADLYKDVVCREHSADVPNLDTSTEASFTSFDTEEEDSRFTDTDCSLADADDQESTITLCHLSSHCANVNSVDNDSSIRITDDVSFQDILRSPIVEHFSADDRMCRGSLCASPEPEIIHAFQETSPSVAELKIQNIYESYNRIVPPLLPNTGATVCRDMRM